MQISSDLYQRLPASSGVYLFSDINNSIIYIGKSKNIKKRVASYFSSKEKDIKTKILVSHTVSINYIEVQSEFEALLLEARLINQHKPKYNIIWKDDKHYIYIKITRNEFPMIQVCRREEKDGYYFGPFPSSHIVKEMLRLIRTIIPFCQQNPLYKHSCFYTHIGLCNPCPGSIRQSSGQEYVQGKKVYQNNIKQIRNLLAGMSNSVQKYLIKQMKIYSQKLNFEMAALYRDKLNKLHYLIQEYEPADIYIENPQLLQDRVKQGQKELIELLKPYYPFVTSVSIIECFDISNISGKHATGAMVTFRNGIANKKLYRKFQIRSKTTPDDFAMMCEMMKRRLLHKEWKLPDLIVIDGGRPQLIALAKVFTQYTVSTPYIGLAKKKEEIVILSNNNVYKIRLSERSSALLLIQKIRDEAHRFAHKYHEHLRLRNLIPRSFDFI